MGDKKKILVVDDSNFLRNALKDLLEKLGYEVIGLAENGLDAITKYKAMKPDLVTLDIIMPQMNGLEALKLLRTVDPNVCVIMVSSMASTGSVTDCLKAGAKNYILKPFDEVKVAKIIEKVFA